MHYHLVEYYPDAPQYLWTPYESQPAAEAALREVRDTLHGDMLVGIWVSTHSVSGWLPAHSKPVGNWSILPQQLV